MKKAYLEPSVDVYELNVTDGVMVQTSSIPVFPGEESDAASRMDFGNGMEPYSNPQSCRMKFGRPQSNRLRLS